MTRTFSLKRIASVLMMTTAFFGTPSFAMSDDTTHSKKATYTVHTDTTSIRIKTDIKLDFSFLRETEKAAEVESIRNFNNDFNLSIKVSNAQKSAGDLESLKNFQKTNLNGGFTRLAENASIHIQWNTANFTTEDENMMMRFNNQFAPKITLDVLSAPQVQLLDIRVLKMFQTQFP